MARDLAIDLGTANTLVYMKGRGIVLNEPSVIALDRQTGEVLATGREAWQMIGRTPGYIVAVRPLRGGAITDFEITERMIRLLLQRVGVSRFTRPKVVICVPSAITEVERRAVTDAARRAGAADANLIEQPMAAAIGADLPVHEPSGNMIVDIGGGTTEVAVISLGGIVTAQSVRVAGDELDDAIMQYVKKEFSLAIGDRTAEEIKIQMGSAWPMEDELTADIRGRDLVSGLPRTIQFTTENVREALAEPVSAIVDAVKTTLDKTPPELAADIMEDGITLTGGGAAPGTGGPATIRATDGSRLPPIPYGLVDLPAEQARRAAVLDLDTDGHLFVIGSPRSGRSQVLRTIAASAARRIGTGDVHLYGLDCGNGALLPLTSLPHCGAVVQRTQVERAQRFVGRQAERARIDAAIERARALHKALAGGAAERDGGRLFPHAELDLVSASGLFALGVPAARGGPGVADSTLVEVARLLAVADPNIAQILQNHQAALEVNVALHGATVQDRQPAVGAAERQVLHEVADGAGLYLTVQRGHVAPTTGWRFSTGGSPKRRSPGTPRTLRAGRQGPAPSGSR